jgi:hypothetical protein
MVAEDQFVTQNFVLPTARAVVSPGFLELIVPAGQIRTRTLTLRNTGSRPLVWQLMESGGGPAAVNSTFKLQRNPAADPNAGTTQGLYLGSAVGWTPQAPGKVITSFPPTGLGHAWGVGYTGNVWLSDLVKPTSNHEFTPAGVPTGRTWPTPWVGDWPADMAYDSTHKLMCQVNVGGDNGIHCWDVATGEEKDSIRGTFDWTSISQRGLAYRPDDDSFYIGGWNQGVLYHVKGLSHADKGAIMGQCSPSDGAISGLAWNPAAQVIWAATNSTTDTIYQLNPDTCTVLGTLAHPSPGFNGGGLEMNADGNLWMLSRQPSKVYLVDSGVPAFNDVPWLSETPSSGTLAVGAKLNIAVTVNTAGLKPGVYLAMLALVSNSGRGALLRIPVSLIVPQYQQGVNAGGRLYRDTHQDVWAADRKHSAGSWGYLQNSGTDSTGAKIIGTQDEPLYQDLRLDPYAYVFDSVPNGVYQVELLFAELQSDRQVGSRLFDVLIKNNLVLPAHDITYEVGNLHADSHSFFVEVQDGKVDVRLVPRRGFGLPIINALRVTQRPDR